MWNKMTCISVVITLLALIATVNANALHTYSKRTPVQPHTHAQLQSQSTVTLGNTNNNIEFTAAALADEVTNMPGLIDTLNFRHFSGYLNASDTTDTSKQIHYWLVLSQNDADTDPLVWWTNGGPGCSGLIALFEEHGPFRVQPDSTTVLLNPYSWNRRASVLYVEAPVGVGFSYATDKDTTYNQSGDDATARQNYIALQSFYDKFPHFSHNELYLSGESYGGHYVPQLAQQYIQQNVDQKLPNITGLFIGNPLIDAISNQYYGSDAGYYGHGLVDLPSWKQVQHTCIEPFEKNAKFDPLNDYKCQQADSALNNVISLLNYDAYGLDYTVCTETEEQRERTYYKNKRQVLLSDDQSDRDYAAIAQIRGSNNDVDYQNACESTYTSEYLNRPDVMTALHVTLNYIGKLDKDWSGCSNTVGAGFVNANPNDFNRHIEIVLQWLFDHAPNMDITIFSGDDDTVCSTLGTQQWLYNFKQFGGRSDLKTIGSWHIWTLSEQPDQTGGAVQNFDGITLVTAHGAGHEVSFYEPALGYDIFNQYIDGKFKAN